MSSFNPIEQLKREGSVALWHDYRLGHANDLSGNGNDGTPSGTYWWDRTGFNTDFMGIGAVEVANSASLDLATLTAVALIVDRRIPQSGVYPTLFAFDSGGANFYKVSMDNPSGFIRVLTTLGVNRRFTPSNLTGLSCIGVPINNNAAGYSWYRDGIIQSAINAAVTIVTSGNNLIIGNVDPSRPGQGFGRTISAFLIFNKLLSAEEHRDVYLELLK